MRLFRVPVLIDTDGVDPDSEIFMLLPDPAEGLVQIRRHGKISAIEPYVPAYFGITPHI